MATKTISVDLTAYHRLSAARRQAGESFSSVIRRAEWPSSGGRGSDLITLLASLKPSPPEVLKTLDANQTLDEPPIDKWL
jgi:predicted CopG family antitoxin